MSQIHEFTEQQVQDAPISLISYLGWLCITCNSVMIKRSLNNHNLCYFLMLPKSKTKVNLSTLVLIGGKYSTYS
jgi:hypothetical protein